ncbi:MAG TPA: HesA/MoeB/ThiF family protein, partial [Candidatus Thermoplasmatota archaeon]|nr:HesA/MoeB/ThiF family protein [Candidatus Thermoplasmatota archaeon]
MTASRFARQLPLLGAEGQRRLRGAKVLVVGLGGLGCPAALSLAGAGVGTLSLMDFDMVEASNLHRQTLYTAADVGRLKVQAARERLLALDPALDVRARPQRFTRGDTVDGHDVALSCTDDAQAQHALSDACQRAGVPLVHAAVSSWEGELAVFQPGGPCLRCLRPAPVAAPTCAVEGVLGPVPGVLGTMQALEAIKLLAGLPPLAGLLLWDGRTGATESVALKRREGCPAHVSTPPEHGPACPLPWNAPEALDIPVHELAPRLEEFFLLDVREPDEHEEFHLPGSTLIPLGQLPRRRVELPRGRPIA